MPDFNVPPECHDIAVSRITGLRQPQPVGEPAKDLVSITPDPNSHQEAAMGEDYGEPLISEDVFDTQLDLSRRFIAIGIRRENGAVILSWAEKAAVLRAGRQVKRMIGDIEVRMVQ